MGEGLSCYVSGGGVIRAVMKVGKGLLKLLYKGGGVIRAVT